MLSSAIVLVANEPYLPHARSVMVNCRRQGKWTGDFCLVIPPEVDATEFTSRGIHVLPDSGGKYQRKFAIMDPFFLKWEIMVYLDCDVLVQAPLAPLLHEVEWGTILADREPFDLNHAFTYFAKPEDLKNPETQERLQWLWDKYDREWNQFNAGIMLWHPRCMPEDGQEQLNAMRDKLQPINTHCGGGSDQTILDLVYYKRFRQVRSNLFCYWRQAWEQTIIVHTCAGYAPWIENPSDQESRVNEKLNRPYYDIYTEHLAAFDKEVPKPESEQ